MDAGLSFFYKIHHGLVAIPMEEYDTPPEHHKLAIPCIILNL
jgi:hypothetical protein